MSSLMYRGRQFWLAMTAQPTKQGMEEARTVLPGALFALFTRLQPSEKAHAIRVFRLVKQESNDHELLVAALLHDIGKIVQPLKVWDRVLIVIVRNVQKLTRTGPYGARKARPPRWAHALVVAEKHPVWGAQLVRKAGGSQLVVRLVRRHQDPLIYEPVTREDKLLKILQMADNVS